MPRDLIERAVAHHTDLAWVKLYVGRWLRAPVEHPDGTLEERTRGTPQGGAVSPGAPSHWGRRLTAPGQPLPALRVRSMDGAGLPGPPVRALRGRCARPLPERGGGADCAGRPSGVAWRNAVWSFIPRRPGSSTARTTTGRGRTNTSRSTSSATPSNRDGRRTGGGDTSSASCRRSAPRPRRRSGRPSAAGGWRPPGTTSAWRIWLAL